ncbi:hypothetical protein [Arenibacterium sp. LLYu02]|uniref:hypothetical protein n=1 Tax=Arenibacterium sp. LLYu02 TaxID=3404132 RepID=UPI003B228C41
MTSADQARSGGAFAFCITPVSMANHACNCQLAILKQVTENKQKSNKGHRVYY